MIAGSAPETATTRGWVHEVRVEDTTFWLRQYEDEAHEMHFLAWDRDTPGERGSFRAGIPYDDRAFAATVR